MGQPPRDEKTEPSLELPSFPGFGRRKKVRTSQSQAAATPAHEPEPHEEPQAPAPSTHDEPTQTLSEVPGETVRNQPSRNGYDEPTRALHADPPVVTDEPTGALLDEENAEAVPTHAPGRRAKSRSEDRSDSQPPEQPPRRKTREPLTTPLVPGAVAAAVTGLLVGGAGAAGTYGAIAGCKAVRGVSSCGGGPGFFILVAIVVLMVLLGTGILRLFRVGDPGSTSFLAVGIVAVISMLVLLDVIFSSSMFVVIPVLSALAFLLAHWVTTRFEDDKGRRDWT